MCAHTLQELKLQRIKIAMVLSSLGIHRLHVSRTTLVFFWQGGSWLYSSVLEHRTCRPSCDLVVIIFKLTHYSSVVVKHVAPEGVNVSGFNFSRFLAVANFANINSNEYFCPVGYFFDTPCGNSMPMRWYMALIFVHNCISK